MINANHIPIKNLSMKDNEFPPNPSQEIKDPRIIRKEIDSPNVEIPVGDVFDPKSESNDPDPVGKIHDQTELDPPKKRLG